MTIAVWKTAAAILPTERLAYLLAAVLLALQEVVDLAPILHQRLQKLVTGLAQLGTMEINNRP